jgi:Glycosyltransferase family 87
MLRLMKIHRLSPVVPLRSAIDALREARWITRRMLLFGGYLFALLSVYLLVSAYRFFTENGLTAPTGQPLAYDFLNLFAGAKATVSGHVRFIYDNQWFSAFEVPIVGPKAFTGIYSYPPVMLLLSLPLGFFSYVPALVLWTLLGGGLGFALLQRLVGWRAAGLALVGTPAAFYSLVFGQNGFFTAVLLGGGLMALERRPIIAGVCFGCLTYKPHLGLLIPAALAAGGYWRSFATAAVTTATLVLASLTLFGTESWVGFLGQMTVERELVETSFTHRIPTVFVAMRVLGLSTAGAYTAQIASGAFALAAVVRVWRAPVPIETKSAVLTVATFLATPFAWDYDTVVLIFAAAWLGREGMRTGFLPWERLAIVMLLVLPMPSTIIDQFSSVASVEIGPVVLWLVLVIVLRRGLQYRFSTFADGRPNPVQRTA